MSESSDYGDWGTVLFFIAFFLIFALSFTRPKTTRDWRSFGAFSGFMVALFVEMYGFPLTLYLLSGWLQSKFPELRVFSHETGHLWHTLFGLEGDPHSGVLDLITTILILGGLVLLGFAWGTLHRAQKTGTLATSGLYGVLRHPQYAAFIVIMFGYLLTWPTLPTLIMFPIMVIVYMRLARREERDAHAAHGVDYERYAAVTPRFFPRLRPARVQHSQ